MPRRSVALGYEVGVAIVRGQGRVDEGAHRGDGAALRDELAQRRSRMSARANPIDGVVSGVARPGMVSFTKVHMPIPRALTYGIGADRDRSVRTGSGTWR